MTSDLAEVHERVDVLGPVVTIQGYADEDEAVARANDSAYELRGAVWSSDPDRALAAVRQLRTGQVDVDGAPFNPAAPVGGYGRSGKGRELGRDGVEESLDTRSVRL